MSRLLDEAQRKYLPASAYAAPPPEAAIAPLPPEQEAALAAAKRAYAAVEAQIDALRSEPAPRAAGCGQRLVIHLRRKAPRRAAAVDEALVRPPCGSAACPYCWHRRLEKTYRRAASAILESDGETTALRTEAVHIAECGWRDWPALDRAIRRQHNGRLGRLRVRRTDGSVLVIAAKPFRCSRPVTPEEAVTLGCEAVAGLHPGKHAFRRLGDWSDKQRSEWRVVSRFFGGELGIGDVSAELTALGIRARRIKTPALTGLVWRLASEQEALALWDRPGFAIAKTDPCRETRTAGEEAGQQERGWTAPHADPQALAGAIAVFAAAEPPG